MPCSAGAAFDIIMGQPVRIQDADELILVDAETHERFTFKRVREGEE